MTRWAVLLLAGVALAAAGWTTGQGGTDGELADRNEQRGNYNAFILGADPLTSDSPEVAHAPATRDPLRLAGLAVAHRAPDGDATVEVDTPPLRAPQASDIPAAELSAVPEAQPDWRGLLSEFVQGYRDFSGNPAWERHFIDDVLPCEGGGLWVGYYWPYMSRAQFDPGSWDTASRNTGLADPDNPYHVGANVAWWAAAIEHPGGTGGWPTCWWRGVVP